MGYLAAWRILNAADFGVPQLRPRVVIVALRREIWDRFDWPQVQPHNPPSVGETLYPLMASRGWRGAEAWRKKADDIAPTIVGGSKKPGGPDLGPTRAKRAWATLGVDGMGIADLPPGPEHPANHMPRLTVDVLTFQVTEIAKTCLERLKFPGIAGSSSRTQKSDLRDLRLLRPRGERPHSSAAKHRNELAPFHSITSSALVCSACGTVSPSTLAVLRLITS